MGFPKEAKIKTKQLKTVRLVKLNKRLAYSSIIKSMLMKRFNSMVLEKSLSFFLLSEISIKINQ